MSNKRKNKDVALRRDIAEGDNATAMADLKKNRLVEASIYKRARGYKIAVKKTYKVKRVEYDPDTGKKTLEREELQTGVDEVHVPADVRAGAYWLNNREPDRWREHPSSQDVVDDGSETEAGGIVLMPDTEKSVSLIEENCHADK